MPLRCEKCNHYHADAAPCRDRFSDLALFAGPEPQPRDEKGLWVLVCSKHSIPLRECCGMYTARWYWHCRNPVEWVDGREPEPSVVLSAGQTLHDAATRFMKAQWPPGSDEYAEAVMALAAAQAAWREAVGKTHA